MSGLCDGRVVVVTGAGGGIGRSHALLFAKEGAKVVVNDIGGSRDGSGAGDAGPAQQVVNEIKAAGGEAVGHTEDISTWDGAKSLIQTAIDTFGTIDVVVNNAGILRDRMMVNMTEAEWDAVIKVHLKGTFGPAHFAAEYWRDKSKAGVVDDDIDGAEGVDRELDEALGAVPGGDVLGVGDGLAAEGLDLVDNALGGTGGDAAAITGAADVVDDELGAFLREQQCVGTANAATGTRDHDYATVAQPTHELPSAEPDRRKTGTG